VCECVGSLAVLLPCYAFRTDAGLQENENEKKNEKKVLLRKFSRYIKYVLRTGASDTLRV
jgi:hypothetical protein